MSLLSKVGKKLKKAVKKVGGELKDAIKSKVGGALVSMIPGVGPVLGTALKVKSVADTVKSVVKPFSTASIKSVAQAAIAQKISVPSLQPIKSVAASMPSAGFGTAQNPLVWPVGSSPAPAPAPVPPGGNMSLFKDIGQAGLAFLKNGPFAPINNAMLPSMPMMKSAASLPVPVGGGGLPAVVGGAARVGPGLVKMGKKAAEALGYIATGGWIFDQAGNIVGKVKGRRMNYMNGRAAKRAIRRIKGVRKICNDIERSLPRAKSSTRRYSGGKQCR